jgi:hypothetical protein
VLSPCDESRGRVSISDAVCKVGMDKSEARGSRLYSGPGT